MATPSAGDIIAAAHVNRARTKWFWEAATAVLPANSSTVAITGISISVTTELAGATVTIWWTMDGNPTAASTTTLIASRPRITYPDTSTVDANVFAVYRSGGSTDRATVGQAWSTTLGAAGTYTFTLLATTGANEQINLYTSLTVAIQEQLS